MSATATPTAPVAPNAPTTPPLAGTGPRPWKWSRADYYKLGELGFFDGKRVELIFGEIVEMSPINWSHQLGKIKLAHALQRAFDGIGWVNEQGPLPLGDSDPQPDVAVFPGRPEDYSNHPRPALLVGEVSDTSLTTDTTRKAALYASAGIADYWVLDVVNRQLHVFRDPQPSPAGPGMAAYRTHLVLGPNDTVTPLAAPGASLPVVDLLP
jgi:Uma2 family endonuclease